MNFDITVDGLSLARTRTLLRTAWAGAFLVSFSSAGCGDQGGGGVGSGGTGSGGRSGVDGDGDGDGEDGGSTGEADGGGSLGGGAGLELEELRGLAQKGPFLNGGSLTLAELDDEFAPSGRTFQTTILDNSGAFNLSNVALAAPVAVLRVDGFFFNEVRNEASSSQITLTALVDFSQKAQANVNLVSHIEKARVEVLLADGIPFEKAKEQALAEVFGIFGFEVESSGFSEDLELAPHVDAEQGVGQGGALGYGGAALDEAWAELSDAATLLAISSIFLGYRSDGSVSEVVANVATDLRLDGDLDSESSLVALVAHARRLDASAIREHLEERYDAFGQSIELPPFEDKIQQFVDAHPEVPFQPLAEYEEGSLLARLASGSDGMTLESGVPLNLRINGHGVPVRLVLKGRPGLWTYLTDGENLDVSNFAATCEQEFSVVDENSPTHNEITFDGPSEFEVEVYEGRFDEPSWTRTFVTSTEHDLGFPISCPEN